MTIIVNYNANHGAVDGSVAAPGGSVDQSGNAAVNANHGAVDGSVAAPGGSVDQSGNAAVNANHGAVDGSVAAPGGSVDQSGNAAVNANHGAVDGSVAAPGGSVDQSGNGINSIKDFVERYNAFVSSEEKVFVSRHKALYQYFLENGLIDAHTKVLQKVVISAIRDKHVLGVMPIHLAHYCKSYTMIPLSLKRGVDLSIDDLKEIVTMPRTFCIRRII